MPDPDRLVNLTGHTLHLYEGGRVVRTIPADGRPYRLPQTELPAEEIDGITVIGVLVDRVGTLPPPVRGVWLIVSQVAALGLAAMGHRRTDVLFPGPGVADRGRMVGRRGLRQLESTSRRAAPPAPVNPQNRGEDHA